MRTPSIGTASYSPSEPPKNAADMQRFIRSELQKISFAITALALGHIDRTHVAPAKPRDGDIRFADGTDWNPGSGVGIYFYESGSATWKLLG